MTDQQAIKVIQSRIEEMLEHKEVRKVMLQAKREGKTTEEIRQGLINVAIATLVGA